MYQSFYGFKEKPFNITPDPRFLYLSAKHREALAQLVYGVKERKGFVVLSGGVGTGKTTIVRAFLEQLDKDCQVAYVFNPKLSTSGFLQYICHDFGLPANARSKADYLIRLHDFLIESHNAGKTSNLIVDEAQNLDPHILEEIRMLTNLETSTQKLLQIFLVGQPQLNEILERLELWQLKQRVSTRYHLLPLDQKETKEYIRTRLGIAGAENLNCLTEDAIEEIYEYSRGVPRLINNICDNSFLIGYASDKRVIDTKIVRESVADLKLNLAPTEHRHYGREEGNFFAEHRALAIIIIVLILVACVGGYLLLSGQLRLKTAEGIRSFIQGGQKDLGMNVSPSEDARTLGTGEGFDGAKLGSDLILETKPMTRTRGEGGEGSASAGVSRGAFDFSSTGIRIVTAREGDTLSTIVFRELGTIDEHLLKAIHQINSEIEDIDQIAVGQEIKLPSAMERAAREVAPSN